MNAEQAKQLNLPALLASLGHHPVKTTNQGQELWYHSPFRKDKTPSFHTSYLNGKWIWNDFGGAGGTVIDFALHHLATNDISQALTFLASLSGRVGEGSTFRAPTPPSNESQNPSTTLQLLSATAVSNPLIVSYLTTTRRIPQPLIRRYLTEITYLNTTTNKQFFAFGLQNQAKGYEIRSASDDHPFKSVIGPRDVTIAPGSNPECGIVSIFEGMLDFLSLLAIMKLQQLEGDAIIMHSLSSYQKTATAVQLGKYQTVNLFLDNDQSGVDVAFRFQQEIPNTVNQAQLFHPHKDLNEFLRASSNVIKKESSTKPQRKQTVGKSGNQETKLKEAKVLEAKLQEQLREQTEEICRTVFRKYPGAKAKAFEEAKHRSGSGYRADRSIAMNMADIRFRDVFKRIVQEQYPEAFKEVEELAIEVSRLQQLIEELT